MIALFKIDSRYFFQVALGQSMPSSLLAFVIAANDLGDHEGDNHDYTGANNLVKEGREKNFKRVKLSYSHS